MSELTLGGTTDNYTFTVDGGYLYREGTFKVGKTETLNDDTQWIINESDEGFYVTNARKNYTNYAIMQNNGYRYNTTNFTCRAIQSNSSLSYLYVQVQESSIIPSGKSFDIVDGTSTSFTVKGQFLTDDIQVSIKDGSGDGFHVTPSSIAATDGEVNNAPVFVTYNGRNNTNATAFIELKSGSTSQEVTVRFVAQNLFDEEGNYYVKNNGNSKYVVIDAENYNATASADSQLDADVVTLAFNDNGIVTTMNDLYGDGDLIAILNQVKTVLKNRLNSQGMNSDFVDQMFNIKLVKTGNSDGSMYFCFDIPAIENVEAVRNYLLSEANLPEIVTGYLDILLQPYKRIYLNAGDSGTFGFTNNKSVAANKWLVEEYVIPEDNLFTTAGDYYVSNKGNSNYVVIDAENYNATASATSQQEADIITLGFDNDGFVTTMKQQDGEGEGSDLIAILEHVKTVLKNRLNGQGLNSDFVDQMFKIKLVKTEENDGSVYFCFDIPKISSINAVRNFLLNEANLPEIVTGYLDMLLQPGKRIYLNTTGEDGAFGFTKDKTPAATKWLVEEYVEPDDDLFTDAGNYYVSNKGNSKYVVIDAENYNATASVGKDDANVVTVAFDENGIVTTMEDLFGDGNMIAILDQVKSVLRNRLPSDINTDFLDEMFKIRLIKSGDEDGSIHFCFVIPKPINDLDRILEVVDNINNEQVKNYLNKLLKPGKHIYLCTADESGTFDFTLDNRLDAAKWMVEAYAAPEDNLFTTAGDYYVTNKGNNKYVVIDAENYNATASADNQQDADIITLGFDGDGFVTTMKQKDGEGEGSDLIAVLEHVKTVLKNRLNSQSLNSDFVDQLFKIKLVKTGDKDGSMYFCFDIPKISKINAVRNFLLNEANLPEIVTGYLNVLLQPGKRIYLNATGNDGLFGFTRDMEAASSMWMVESTEVVEDELFNEAGDYLVSNKGNNKFVVIDAQNYNATASVGEDDADVISIAFDENSIVTTMKQVDGDGDMIAILDQVKSVLRERLPEDIETGFLDEMFKIKLVKTGDKDGSIYFCFDIPSTIDDLDRILAVVDNINNERVKDYLKKLLQPGKRIYLYVDDLEQGTFNFTKDKRLDAAKWLALSVEDSDGSIIIYFDKETADSKGFYIWTWDENDGADNPHYYFSAQPGVQAKSLPTTKIGNTKTVYKFSYRYKAKEPRLIMSMGEGQHQTEVITPKPHEIFFYYGGDEYVYNDGEPRTEPSYTIGVPVDEIIFPDEGFRMYMKDGKFGKSTNGSFQRYDTEPSNDVFEPWEIEKAEILTATTDANVTIKDFTGIEYFTYLKEISLIGGRLSESSYLTLDFEVLDLTMLKNNSLECISVSHADKMTTFELPEGHPLKSLRLSSCNAMPVGTLNERLATYSETLEELKLEYCRNFAELDISENNKLKILEIYSVPIPSLDLTGKNDLEVLRLSSTNITNDINNEIADKSKLRELSLSSNNNMTATALNIANKPDLEKLRIYNQNNYETITIDNAGKLNYMDIEVNDNLTTLNMPTLTAMKDMWIENNPNLEGCTVDLTGNSSLEQININFNKSASTIKGMGSQMTNLISVKTEHQRYDGNVLDLSNCANLHQLDVIDCNLDRLSVDGCTALGSKIPGDRNDKTLLIYSNYLRALNLDGVELPYNFNVSPGADGLDGINKYFMPDSYVYHAGYNSQIVPTIKPTVAYLFYENYNPNNPGAKTHTYAVYVSLESGGEVSDQDTNPYTEEAVPTLNDLFRQAAQKRALEQADEYLTTGDMEANPNILDEIAEGVADVGFDYKRVKLWSRFDVQWDQSITKQNDKVQVIHGNKGSRMNSPRPKAAGENPPTELDPAEVKGEILLLGIYTVPEGEKEAKVSGTVSYMYDTRNAEATMAPEYNGDFVTESEVNNYYKNMTLNDYNTAANTASGVNPDYDNTFPVEFNWEITLSDTPEEVVTNLNKIDLNKAVTKVTYVNLMGVESDRPFEGVNIVVTHYTDGSVTTTKVIR
ncbi:MAG: hypothetical protein J5629_05170 [Muribaculaceae bacterium]|nr:hypothetical protein [Muribaculaceae bacterium]